MRKALAFIHSKLCRNDFYQSMKGSFTLHQRKSELAAKHSKRKKRYLLQKMVAERGMVAYIKLEIHTSLGVWVRHLGTLFKSSESGHEN